MIYLWAGSADFACTRIRWTNCYATKLVSGLALINPHRQFDRTHEQVDDQGLNAKEFTSSHSPSSTHHDTSAGVIMSLRTKLAIGNASTVLCPSWSSGVGAHV